MNTLREQVQVAPSWTDSDPEALAAFKRCSPKAQLVQIVEATDALVENEWRLGEVIGMLEEWMTITRPVPDASALSLVKAVKDISVQVGNAAFILRRMTASVALRDGCGRLMAESLELDEDEQMERTVILGEAAGVFGLFASSQGNKSAALAVEIQQRVLHARQLSEDLIDTAAELRAKPLRELGHALESASAAADVLVEQIDGAEQSSVGVWAAVRLVAGVKREMESIIRSVAVERTEPAVEGVGA